MNIRKLRQSDIETKTFEHQYTAGGAAKGGFVVIRQFPDGYVEVRPFTGKGLAASATAWSGCLSPERDMKPELVELAIQARKI